MENAQEMLREGWFEGQFLPNPVSTISIIFLYTVVFLGSAPLSSTEVIAYDNVISRYVLRVVFAMTIASKPGKHREAART